MFLIMPCSKLPSQSLQWGKADTLSKLPSCLSPPVVTAENGDIGFGEVTALYRSASNSDGDQTVSHSRHTFAAN
jgi:hypothetical protein